MMIIVPKWEKRVNQWLIDKSFGILKDTINRMNNNKARNSPGGTNTKPREAQVKGTSLKWFELPGSCYFS